MNEKWYTGTVVHGSKIGRTLGFPTANFNPAVLVNVKRDGVYAARVKIDNIEYTGALFIGPRLILGENQRVLEIFIFDFSDDLYSKTIEFQLKQFIREPKDFLSHELLIKQIEDDVRIIRKL